MLKLKECLERVQEFAPQKNVYLGSKSGYVVIGHAIEVLQSLDELDNRWSYEGLKENQLYVPFAERKVLDSYALTSTDDGIAIIVEGEEQGPYWDLEEFRKKAV